jgi:cytochrome P450
MNEMVHYSLRHQETNMATLDEATRPAAVTPRRSWPGPRGHWLFGCVQAFQSEPLNFPREAWRTYGDYVRLRLLPGFDLYLIVDPAAVEHVLVKNYKNYRKPSFLTGPVRLLTGNGLFTSEGDFWLRQRRLAQPAFVRSAVTRLASSMTEAADALLREWDAAPDGRVVDIVPEMMRLVLRIAAATLFGADISTEEADALGKANLNISAFVRYRMNSLLAPPLWVPTRRNRAFHRAKSLLDGMVLRIIGSRRRSGPAGNDLLDMLLAARDDESGTGMTDQQLKDEVVTLMFAGHDTTAAAISWAWHLLARHQDVQESLYDEVSSRLAGRTPTAEDLPRLPLATAIFEETLRLYPPAPGLCRQALAPDEIQGYPIPAKAWVMPSQWVTHRHPAYWEEPDRFRPERFLPGRAADRPKLAYFPFGAGPRGCIGNTFAMIEGALVLAAMVQRFRVRPADEREVEIDPTFVLRPKGPVNLIVRKRS